MMKRQRKKKSKIYFGTPVQNAIIRYNDKVDKPSVQNKNYKEHIQFSFNKLAENLIHTFKFYYIDYPIESVKHDVISFMITRLDKYKQGKGKAFSYFSVVVNSFC